MTRLDACQYRLGSQSNDTLTHVADHGEQGSHDAIPRSFQGARIPPRLLGENVRGQGGPTPQGSVLFADPGRTKHDAFASAWVRAHSSGPATAVLNGRGGVPGVDVQPDTAQCWRRDSRLSAPEGEGTRQRAPGRERLPTVVSQQPWPGQAGLRDPGEATKACLVFLAAFAPISSWPLTAHRQGDASGRHQPSRRVETRAWHAQAVAPGKRLTITGCPTDPKGPLCRGEVSPHRTACVVPHALTQEAPAATHQAGGFRGKSEPWHREGPQGTGLERCQCRTARTPRHPLGGAFRVWGRLKARATHPGRTIDQRTHGFLEDALVPQRKKPSLKMALA